LYASIADAFELNMNKEDKSLLYLYSGKDISSFLKRKGYPELKIRAPWEIVRNADGTALFFFDWTNNKAIMANCNGVVKEILLPGKQFWRGKIIWFGKENNVAAWYEDGDVHFMTDKDRVEILKEINKTSLSGGFYPKIVKSTFNENVPIGTEIYSIVDPMTPLARIMDFRTKNIFLHQDKLLIFGGNFFDMSEQEYLYNFQLKDKELLLVNKMVIKRPAKSPAPFYAQDLNSTGDEVLFVDVFDVPSRSEWYVYNLKTQEMRKIGKQPFSDGSGFYLQCDILKENIK
jgi:hypothetical protein